MVAQLDGDYTRLLRTRSLARLATYGGFEGRPLTTRGKAVNPLVLAHLRLAARFPTRPVDRPIFIVGVGRSGTTLLGKLLGGHPEVGFLNEPKAVWHTIHPGEDVIGTYSVTPGRLRLGEDDASEAVRARAHHLYSYYSFLTRSARVVDKYPELVFRHEFIRAIFPDAVFVMISRGPQSVAQSITQWSSSHRDGGADWWGLHDRKWRSLWGEGVLADERTRRLSEELTCTSATPEQRALIEWTLVALEIDRLRSKPDTVFVRYEDLTADVAVELPRLLDQLGLAPSPRLLDYATRTVTAPVVRQLDERQAPPILRDLIRSAATSLGHDDPFA